MSSGLLVGETSSDPALVGEMSSGVCFMNSPSEELVDRRGVMRMAPVSRLSMLSCCVRPGRRNCCCSASSLSRRILGRSNLANEGDGDRRGAAVAKPLCSFESATPETSSSVLLPSEVSPVRWMSVWNEFKRNVLKVRKGGGKGRKKKSGKLGWGSKSGS